MQIAQNEWQLVPTQAEVITELTKDGTISPHIARLLSNRGITKLEAAQHFLQVDKATFSNPNMFYDMDKAVERIKRAINKNEKIIIFGDYDADGITSTSIMMLALTELGSKNHSYYIPNRLTEGYGPTLHNINKLAQTGLDLLITVDTGIVAHEALEHLSNLKIDCIITDHHQAGTNFPKAVAILHPERTKSTTCKVLSGAGVAFQFSYALLEKIDLRMLVLAAIGTIADLVPLQEENRIIVYNGLKALKESPSIGIRSLIKLAGLNIDSCNETDIAFSIVPRLNAAGRLSSADHAVNLLLTDNQDSAIMQAAELEKLNELRKQLVNTVTAEAINLMQKQENNNNIVILHNNAWHKGIIGIVASKLVDKMQKPAIICSLDETTDEVTCSGRSITGFNLIVNLQKQAHLFTHYGGHPQAVGFSCPLHNLKHLQIALNEAFFHSREEITPKKVLNIDLEINLSDLTTNFIADLDSLRPYGSGNAEPKLLMQNVLLRETAAIGAGDKHLRGKLCDKSGFISTIAFNMGHLINHISVNDNLNVVGTVAINNWRNKTTLQWSLEDINCQDIQIFDFRNKPLTAESMKIFTDLPMLLFSRENLKLIPEAIREMVQLADDYLLQTNLPTASTGQDIILIDFPSSLEQLVQVLKKQTLSKLYVFFKQPQTALLSTLPTRNQFKDLYIFFKKYTPININKLPAVAKTQKISLKTLKWMLAVFIELEFIFQTNNNFIINPTPEKKNLLDSPFYEKRQAKFTMEKNFLLSDTKQLTKNILNIIT